MNGGEYTFHEDFSGAGMARLGLGPNWSCLRACDIDAKKCQAYRQNFNAEDLFEGDVGAVNVTAAKPAQLAWASFPCQDTSLAGGYAGLAGKRSGTFWAWWGIVEGMKAAGKPYDILCIENVRGLLTTNNGTDFAAICEALAKAGYMIGAAVIDAAYFLPQSRERLFIVGIRGDKELIRSIAGLGPNSLWHPPSMLFAHTHLTENALKHWFWLNLPAPAAIKPKLADIIADDPEGVEWHTAAETKRLISMMSAENLRKLSEQKKKKARVIGMGYKRTRNGQQQVEIRFDGVAGCLRTAKGGSSRQLVFVVNGNKIRSRLLSPREAASLMGMPKTYKLPEKYNDAYNLCGDGVAVPVVRFLAQTVFEPIIGAIQENMIEDAMVAAE